MKSRFKEVKEKLEAKLNADKTNLSDELLKMNEELLQKLDRWSKMIG